MAFDGFRATFGEGAYDDMHPLNRYNVAQIFGTLDSIYLIIVPILLRKDNDASFRRRYQQRKKDASYRDT